MALPYGRHVLTGDFNMHHPLWDKAGRCSTKANILLELAQRWDLELATPWGLTTRFGPDQLDSTIDHVWATDSLAVDYYGDAGLAGSDHLAQAFSITDDTPQPRRAETPRGWNWALLDFDATKAAAANLLPPPNMTSTQDIDNALTKLIKQLQDIADLAAPRRKGGSYKAARWWNKDVQDATKEVRDAQRAYRLFSTEHTWRVLQQAKSKQKHTAQAAKTKRWRRDIANATSEPKRLWKICKWARQHSHIKPASAAIPPLTRSEDEAISAYNHADKAKLLAERFFPAPPADLSDIQDRTFSDETGQQKFEIERTVCTEDVQEILRGISAWKAPGLDDLPTGFLRACGKPLAEIIATTANACLKLEYFPERFRCAEVVVLAKPGKTGKIVHTPGAYRPIALLSTIGKVIEKIMGDRIAAAAEKHNLLPQGQMGNRPGRSTELAIRMVTDAAYTAWKHGATTSLLQLDIKGAFDTVNHIRLLDTLRKAGFPIWVVRWIRSYLEARTACLRFDGEMTDPFNLQAGVPQGSPLSPILFILYIASLYEAIRVDGILVVGFADDTNLLSYSNNIEANCRRLESAWKQCKKWAQTRGMQFAPGKSELLHFSRAHQAPTQHIQLGDALIKPVESARFLGVWLDRKLRWTRHLRQLKTKLATQQFALTKLAASTWGVSISRAREVYIKVIRSALAYGASIWHTPSGEKEPRGPAKQLMATQSHCLRIAAGAYQATPVHCLETELAIPPLDLYLDQRKAEYERAFQISDKSRLVSDWCSKISRWLLRHRRRRRKDESPPIQARQEPRLEVDKLNHHWKARWQRNAAAARMRRLGRYLEPAEEGFPTKDPLLKHKGLLKHESSVLIQLRTGKIGLNSFLHRRRVPDIQSPLCSCGLAPETPCHIVVDCPLTATARERLDTALAPQAIRSHRDFAATLEDTDKARIVARWFLTLNRLKEFRLAIEIGGTSKERAGRKRTGKKQANDRGPAKDPRNYGF
jgi:Reverse transcriptase (RNA-dependent DNA polymerase)/Endonuclease-reverse transcriptase